MILDEITEKIIESKNNDIAKAFTMHIGSLLLNNGIVPIMTGYTRNDVKNITDTDEYKLVMEYGITFKELDCSKHDKEIYNNAIDDFIKFANTMPTVETDDGEIRPMWLEEMAEQLKEGGNIELSEHSKSQGNRTGKQKATVEAKPKTE